MPQPVDNEKNLSELAIQMDEARAALYRVENNQRRSKFQIIERIILPFLLGSLTIAVGYATVIISGKQVELGRQIEKRQANEAKHAREIKFLELFWTDYTSESSLRQEKGMILLDFVPRDVVSRLASALIENPNLDPARRNELVKIGGEAANRNLSLKDELQPVVNDPTDIIAIARLIDELVERGQYKDATELVSALKTANRSGVGYSAFPSIILAFAMTSDMQRALDHISELRSVVTTEVLQRSGYLSRAEQISWIWTSLKTVESELTPGQVRTETKALAKELNEIVSDLNKPKSEPGSNAMKTVLSTWTDVALGKENIEEVEGFDWSRLQISGLIETLSIRGKYDKAVKVFEKNQPILENALFVTYEPYLAISYDMIGESDDAEKILSEIKQLFLQDMRRGLDASYMEYQLAELEKLVSTSDDNHESFNNKFDTLVQELAVELGQTNRRQAEPE